MSKIMFIGDPHIQNNTPSSRKEEYSEYRQLILDKLNWCAEYCRSNDIKTIIYLGDIYNYSTDLSTPYLNKCFELFNEINNMGIKQYSIIGNHDTYYNNDKSFDNTLLNLTFTSGLIKHLDTLNIDDVHIVGVDFNKPIPTVKFQPNICAPLFPYKICVAHCFYDNEFYGGTGDENITPQQGFEYGYNAYVLGHDHKLYDMLDMKSEESCYSVIRPGSLMRGSSKTCNLYRQVRVATFDTETKLWNYIVVPTKPGVEVFKESVVLQKGIENNLDDLLENFEAQKTDDVYSIIDKDQPNGREKLKDIYDEVINVITLACESVGVYRRGDIEF